MIPGEWFHQAARRLEPHIRRTLLSNDAELNLFLKWENQQVTGSFKARGALNKVFTLADWERKAGLVTASAGNHGQGVALAGKITGTPVLVFASEHAVENKLTAMRALGAQVRLVPGGYELAEKTARLYASETNTTYISAYNDGQVIAGQGTIGLEIMADLPNLERMTIVVPVGGGGLLAGIGAALSEAGLRPHLVGVNPEASAFMQALFKTGSQVNVPDLPTLADGLSGAVEPDSLTIPMVRNYTEDILTVSEDEIRNAIAFSWKKYSQVIEGSGAVGIAAVLAGKVKLPAIVIVTGGNIHPDVHAEICQYYLS